MATAAIPRLPLKFSYFSHFSSLSFPTKPRQVLPICYLSVHQSNDQTTNANPKSQAANNLRIAFAAGGTGGHIYPAVAIADELKLADPNIEILFLGTPSGMESSAIPSAGYNFVPISAIPLARPFLSPRNLLFPYRLIKSLIDCYKELSDFEPQIVVGTGGYVSFPVCFVASLKGLKLMIQEQNAVPGIANWVLSFFANSVFVAFNSTVDCFPRKKCLVCGNPVRLSLRQPVPKETARLRFFPKSGVAGDLEPKVVLVLGGSLGANAINIAMLNLYYQMLLENNYLYIIWQTGVEAFNEMESLVKNHPRLLLKPFLRSMDLAYATADLIVSRAGAMTCSEIMAAGKPSILIPSPNVAEGHQLKNASLMADVAGSKVITEDELDSTTLAIAIEEILGDETKMAYMCEKALKAAKPDASSEIAQHILALAYSSKSVEK